jgi:predicted Fe-Mo cluster-binding NifX family protein
MKIAVSSYGRDLDSQLDSRFSRCPYFLVVNPNEMSFEVFKNENAVPGGGAGIQSAQLIASKGVDAVITGNCGPNTVQTLSAAGIDLFAGQKGTVREVVERFKQGKLKPTGEATVDGHFGNAHGADFGPGEDRGRGRGMGGGGSMVSEPALSRQRTPEKKGSGSVSKDLELEALKKKADELNRQVKGIISRIHQLETRD